MTPLSGTLSAAGMLDRAAAEIAGIHDILFYFGISRKVEPIGFLHLERLNFIPAGIERGELDAFGAPQPLRGGQHQP